MSAWTVSIPNPIYIYSQLNSPTYDGSRPMDEFYLNCGETVLAMCVKHLRDVFVSPDTIHDQIVGEGKALPTTEQMLENWLQNFCNIRATAYYPTVMQTADKTGALDICWQYLSMGSPLIVLGDLVIGSTHYNHWRMIVKLSDQAIWLLDPWTGAEIQMSWDQFKTNYRGILIGIEDTRPATL